MPNPDGSWTDREKYFANAYGKVVGWGIAAALAFLGWLVGSFDLEWIVPKGKYLNMKCMLTWGSILGIGLVWCAAVTTLWSQAKCVLNPQTSNEYASERLSKAADRFRYALPWTTLIIVLTIAALAAFD